MHTHAGTRTDTGKHTRPHAIYDTTPHGHTQTHANTGLVVVGVVVVGAAVGFNRSTFSRPPPVQPANNFVLFLRNGVFARVSAAKQTADRATIHPLGVLPSGYATSSSIGLFELSMATKPLANLMFMCLPDVMATLSDTKSNRPDPDVAASTVTSPVTLTPWRATDNADTVSE